MFSPVLFSLGVTFMVWQTLAIRPPSSIKSSENTLPCSQSSWACSEVLNGLNRQWSITVTTSDNSTWDSDILWSVTLYPCPLKRPAVISQCKMLCLKAEVQNHLRLKAIFQNSILYTILYTSNIQWHRANVSIPKGRGWTNGKEWLAKQDQNPKERETGKPMASCLPSRVCSVIILRSRSFKKPCFSSSANCSQARYPHLLVCST